MIQKLVVPDGVPLPISLVLRPNGTFDLRSQEFTTLISDSEMTKLPELVTCLAVYAGGKHSQVEIKKQDIESVANLLIAHVTVLRLNDVTLLTVNSKLGV